MFYLIFYVSQVLSDVLKLKSVSLRIVKPANEFHIRFPIDERAQLLLGEELLKLF